MFLVGPCREGLGRDVERTPRPSTELPKADLATATSATEQEPVESNVMIAGKSWDDLLKGDEETMMKALDAAMETYAR